jgi:hypothetical protein
VNDHETRVRELEKLAEIQANLIRDLKLRVLSLEQQLRDARGG